MKVSSLLAHVCFASSVLAAYDQNRAGAVLKAPEGDPFQTVTGTFTVPNLTGNSKLSIWVGIGDSVAQDYAMCGNLLQMQVLGGGIVFNRTLATWSAWFPGAAIDTTSQVPVKASDQIVVTVTQTSATAGTVQLENKTQNKKSIQELALPASASEDVSLANVADWWVQAYQAAGELVTTPNYGTLAFTACSATTASGKSVPLTGAGRFEVQGTSGQVYSVTTITADGVSVRRSANPVRRRV
ncbi:concanavalin A-like lectin/glucanase [Amniculicola lignicola CBS 123094]|uniref:Concanavalin A-like lectin/glucanase n=1 Tax=Amniculicola lignicola CBS 123094 TaxID=1392246 RepID=A0A6A5WP58_9PLEO|nr:concanavalin A-like lectin/glucanase [Amniculicola lignicola CBS 123094]